MQREVNGNPSQRAVPTTANENAVGDPGVIVTTPQFSTSSGTSPSPVAARPTWLNVDTPFPRGNAASVRSSFGANGGSRQRKKITRSSTWYGRRVGLADPSRESTVAILSNAGGSSATLPRSRSEQTDLERFGPSVVTQVITPSAPPLADLMDTTEPTENSALSPPNASDPAMHQYFNTSFNMPPFTNTQWKD